MSISELPPELLGLILLTVYRDHGSGCLAHALRVSKHWHEVGKTLLWQNLVLGDFSIEKFADSIGGIDTVKPILTDRLESLTLEIISPEENYSSDQSFTRNLHTFASLLPSMAKLKSFSVTSRYDAYSPWMRKQATDDIVVDLVSHLPSSIQHLEVDLPIVYFPRVSAQSCLCEVVSNRLDGLHSLHLRWPRICSKLFSRRSTTLKYVSLDYMGAGLSPYVRGCASARSSSRMSWDELQQQSHKLSQAAVRDVLDPLRNNPRRVLPQIRHFVIVEPYRFWPIRSSHQWFLLNVHSISERGSTEKSHLITRSYPIWPTGFIDEGSYKFIIRYCTHDKPSESDQNVKHACAELDRNGSGRAMCRVLEDIAAWTTNDVGARIPLFTQRTSSQDIMNKFLDKAQWQATYEKIQEAELSADTMTESIEEPSPSSNLEADIEVAKAFQGRTGVKAAMVGADYIWFLEDRLGRNLLCARHFLGEFPNDSDDKLQEQFTSAGDLLREVQKDVPWDT